MKEVRALAVMTRPELEKALAQMNVTRHDMHKLIELQQARIAELEGTLPGRIKGAQALADEKCRCFLARAETAEARLAVYNSGGFADADALAATYLDISAERDEQQARIAELRETLTQIAYCKEHPQCTAARAARKALAATEPRP